MARNYYSYLVSGLPDLLFDGSKNVPPFRTVVDEVMQELSLPDREFVGAMMLPVDNKNLVSILESGEEFDDRGNYTRDELASFVRLQGGADMPEYMQTFLSAHKEGRQLFPGLSALDQLMWLFYDTVAESNNDFVKNWFDFDANLRNVTVGINIRKEHGHIEAIAAGNDRPANLTVVGRGDAAEAVLRSTAPDFGLTASHQWVEKVIALGKGGLTEMETGLDELRWGMLEELSPLDYFQMETIAIFVAKLQIVYRWMKLDPVAGREKLDRLVGELMKNFVMPEGF